VRWSVVVPVKRLPVAKTRLRGVLAGVPHDALALALALDTVRAALAALAAVPAPAAGPGRVVVVSSDQRAGSALRALGAVVVPDVAEAGLNAALAHGAQAARDLDPAGGVASLSADLPALRPGELGAALSAAADHPRALVSDAAGTGTTLLTAAPGWPLAPRYGPGSRAAHRAGGAVELPGAWPSLRRDVDTATDLAAARELGVGPALSALLATRAASGRTVSGRSAW